MNQCERVLQYLADFGSITQAEAMLDIGVMRLASRINDLRNAGHAISAERVQVINRYGEQVMVARYSMG